ncbi:thiamine biosynthesis protein ThiS [[Clostridium] scindens ATCC 35704]|nr:sulfur carrier protein ThiS [[Clostridium] scindens]EDS05927.1 thiamine biosynthesis protein ThiS [[Clostridium] scindens ATCC 35704]MBO1681547.1 sulfur carrier protein ThiS [[Clostridium] scindens]MDY4866299.1 sulfur carrier protein ThiS [[Clostridium] scindens]MEE0648062.1 sulfur carrier protein ThiS [[Clostridium] scindens]
MMVKVNGTEREYRPGMSVLQLLEEMGYSITRVAVEKNGEIVPKNRLSDTYLEDEDSLEVVSFVGGG